MDSDAILERFTCSGCGGSDLALFLEQANVPTHVGIQWPSPEEARACPRGDIVLGFCSNCGLVMNVAYDADQVHYGGQYENALDVSPVYREYARAEAERLIELGKLRHKTVLEIGCGKGDFLQMICRMGENRGIGLDPTTADRPPEITNDTRLTFLPEVYSERHAQYHADLICCRQVLEHMPRPGRFLKMLRAAIGDKQDTLLYLEVPNLDYIVRTGAIWTVIYEHCSYFSPRSLAYLLASCGFEIIRLAECFEDQFLSVEAAPARHIPAPVEPQYAVGATGADSIICFVDRCTRKIRRWRSEIQSLIKGGERLVAWGAGARAVTFFNHLGLTDQIPYVVDINPRKEGRYLPGTAQKIVSPLFLKEYQPTTIIVMNRIYKDEIHRDVEKLGLHPRYRDVEKLGLHPRYVYA